jgi:hypothetical protein
MSARLEPMDQRRYRVKTDRQHGLTLPKPAAVGDMTGHCKWLTSAFHLDPEHPITGGRREGLRGPFGHVVLYRADAGPLRFEPVTRLHTPLRLIESVEWQLIPSDGELYGYKKEHCGQIAYVVRMLCDLNGALTDEQEAAAVVATFMLGAQAVEGCTTYGTSGQRYEAVVALRRRLDEPGARYLLDHKINSSTGELIETMGGQLLTIAASDLQDAARKHVGSTLPRGWVDGRMDALRWERITLQGYSLPGVCWNSCAGAGGHRLPPLLRSPGCGRLVRSLARWPIASLRRASGTTPIGPGARWLPTSSEWCASGPS